MLYVKIYLLHTFFKCILFSIKLKKTITLHLKLLINELQSLIKMNLTY